MIRILVADDHELVREGVKKVLSRENDLKIVAEASNASEVLEKLSQTQIDVVLLDINMPGRSGLEVIADIRKYYPGVRTLVLSMLSEETIAVRALKLGAAGYFSKEGFNEELLNAIRKVAAGGRYVSQKLADQLAESLGPDAHQSLHGSLSEREFEVLCLIARGKKVSEIAGELSLGIPTVSTYRTRILEKMKMKTNADLIRYAIQNKLVDGL